MFGSKDPPAWVVALFAVGCISIIMGSFYFTYTGH